METGPRSGTPAASSPQGSSSDEDQGDSHALCRLGDGLEREGEEKGALGQSREPLTPAQPPCPGQTAPQARSGQPGTHGRGGLAVEEGT